MSYRMKRAWRRVKAPFQTRVLVFEHTRIRTRSFPPLFEHEWCESIHDRAARGGVVDCRDEPGTFVLYEPIRMSKGMTLKNGSFDLSPPSNGPFIKVVEAA